MSERVCCDWCGCFNKVDGDFWPHCNACKHRADVPRSQCDCTLCSLPPIPTTAEKLLEAFGGIYPAPLPDIPQPMPAVPQIPLPATATPETPRPLQAEMFVGNNRGGTVRGRGYNSPRVSWYYATDGVNIWVDDDQNKELWFSIALSEEQLLDLLDAMHRVREYEAIAKAVTPPAAPEQK